LTRGSFFLVSITSSKWWAAFSGPVRVVMITGLPVVSSPYMPAALIPMPCWPRLCRRRWNFEP
jgi:hypothetical protein